MQPTTQSRLHRPPPFPADSIGLHGALPLGPSLMDISRITTGSRLSQHAVFKSSKHG